MPGDLGRSGPVAPAGCGHPRRASDAATVLTIDLEHGAALGAAAPSTSMEFCVGAAAAVLWSDTQWAASAKSAKVR